MGGVSAYQFAESPTHTKRTMAWYASMFPDGPVVDVGAGRGYFLEALRSRGIRGLGVDVSDEAGREARRLGVDVVVQDAFSFLAEQRGLGGAFLSHLIEHLEPARVDELLRLTHDALQPNGTIVIVTPNPADWLVLSEIFWLDPTHVRPYPPRLVVAMLQASGFRVEATGQRSLSLGRRRIPGTILNRIRFGSAYGRGESWIRARRT